MTRQQDADAMLEAYQRGRKRYDLELRRRQAAKELRAVMIRDAVACALIFGGIGAAFLFPWGAL